ncbi:MAG: L-lactate permease [Tissierellia bacterium]|nr:L-lactate permease [Tissierellia bacterium]
MNIPINILTWSMAFLPIIVLIILLVGINMSASKAAIIGLLITLITSVFVFKADLNLLLNESLKGVWSAFIIILIVWTAILLYQVGDKANGFTVIRDKIGKMFPNELIVILMFGWIFESFLQGITGFGVPVAVGAPILIGLGVNPIYAVIIALLGQSFGNTFGTLGAAWDSLTMSASLQPGSDIYLKTALWAAIFLFVWDFFLGLVISFIYGGVKGVKKGFLAVLILALIQGGGQIILSQINPTLSNFIPALISFVGLIGISKLNIYNKNWRIEDSKIMLRDKSTNNLSNDSSNLSLLEAFMPYILLSILTLVILTVGPIREALSTIRLGFSFDQSQTAYGYVNEAVEIYSPLTIFTHASFFLFISSLVGLIYYINKGAISKGSIGEIIKKTNKMTTPSAISILALVVMSNLMSGTGQTVVLASGFANILGRTYLIISPFIGLLGTFMTGSNMSSNILFSGFQAQTANLLSVSSAKILGAQTTGGAIGAAVSPSKIILGTTTANILGKEGKILKKLLLITVPFTLVLGIVILLTI